MLGLLARFAKNKMVGLYLFLGLCFLGASSGVVYAEITVTAAEQAVGITPMLLERVGELLKDASFIERHSLTRSTQGQLATALLRVAFQDAVTELNYMKGPQVMDYFLKNKSVFLTRFSWFEEVAAKKAAEEAAKAGAKAAARTMLGQVGRVVGSAIPLAGPLVAGGIFLIPCWRQHHDRKKAIECAFNNAGDIGSAW